MTLEALYVKPTHAPAEPLQVRVAGDPGAASAEVHRRWARHALMAATSLGALGSFLAVSRMIHHPRANALDEFVMRAIARARSPQLNEIVRDLTSLGGVTIMTITAATAVRLTLSQPATAAQIALGGFGGALAEFALKRVFARPRPVVVRQLQAVTTHSFPSGHALASACMYLTLAFVGGRRVDTHHTRLKLLAAAGVLAGAVGLTRVYLGVHYPTDIIGGLAIGTAWACLLEAIFDYAGARQIEARRREVRQSAQTPHPTEALSQS